MKTFVAVIVGLMMAMSGLAVAQGEVLVRWDFNSIVPDAATLTGNADPSENNTGSTATFEGINGTTYRFSTANDGSNGGASIDPADNADDSSALSEFYAAQGTGSGTRGVQWSVSTEGYEDIIVSWDQRTQNFGSRFWSFQYSTDGVSFTDFATYETTNPLRPVGQPGFYWFPQTYDLSAITALDDQPEVFFRAVAIFQPGTTSYVTAGPSGSYNASTGFSKFDYITVSGTPLTPAFVEGDADSDGDVDFDDLGILLGNYDLAGLPAFTGGDSDGDGDVDFDDLGLLLGNYGFGVLPTALDAAMAQLDASGVTASVPEPSFAGAAGLMGLALLRRSRR